MAEKKQNTGPDFSQGVLKNLLEEGVMLRGHVGNEPVILVRQQGQYFAVGAKCSHYGAPLNEGVLIGDTVHCPWHHACFDLKTGDALKPPALNPIAAWNVMVKDDRVYVTDKKVPVITPRPETSHQQFVIVGAGAAGTSAAVMLRRQGFQGSVILIGEDRNLPYDRPPLSKDFLAGKAPEAWIPLYPKEFYEENKIHLELGVRVVKLDSHRQSMLLSNGKTFRYDRCLLATGGEPVHPPIPGIQNDNVYYLRTLQDSRRIIARTSWSKKVAIIGAGFIGLEVASSLRQRNMQVHVIAPEEMPLMKIVGVHVGSFIKRMHEQNGVHFHLGHTVKEIRDRSILLDDGKSVDCDFVIVGTGIRPNITLAQQAGCHIDAGVSVDSYLETTVPGIFAAGDIARWPDPRSHKSIRVEHWEVAERQGQIAARNMMGDQIRYQDVPFFWTRHYGLSLGYVGYSDSFDRMEVFGDMNEKNFAVAYYEDHRIAALLTVGRDEESLLAEEALENLDEKKVNDLVKEYERRSQLPF